jgi:hypothetical protein
MSQMAALETERLLTSVANRSTKRLPRRGATRPGLISVKLLWTATDTEDH